MPLVSSANGSDVAGMSRRCQPVVNCRSDGPPANWRIAGALVPSDQKQQPIAARDRLVERSVDGLPCTIETHSMKIDEAVRLDRAVAKPSVPAAVEGAGPETLPNPWKAVSRWWSSKLLSDCRFGCRLHGLAFVAVA